MMKLKEALPPKKELRPSIGQPAPAPKTKEKGWAPSLAYGPELDAMVKAFGAYDDPDELVWAIIAGIYRSGNHSKVVFQKLKKSLIGQTGYTGPKF